MGARALLLIGVFWQPVGRHHAVECLRVGVGKLGGREIGYGSDLDVLFVFDPKTAPPDRDPTEHFVRRAQRIIGKTSAQPKGEDVNTNTSASVRGGGRPAMTRTHYFRIKTTR